MDLRVQLIQDHDGGESIADWPKIYGISRKTIYKLGNSDKVVAVVERKAKFAV